MLSLIVTPLILRDLDAGVPFDAGASLSSRIASGQSIGEFVRGYEATVWLGIGAPKNTPSDIIARRNREINSGLADPRLKARFAKLGDAVFASSPTELAKLIAEDTEKWGKLIRRSCSAATSTPCRPRPVSSAPSRVFWRKD
jgi:hypothetical protein